jgi:hypothetical protein
MDRVCHGCKKPARQDEDKCFDCGKWIVTRADLKIWSRTRPIDLIAIIAFALFCWLRGVHCTNDTFVTTGVCIAVPMFLTGWMMKLQAPRWMHPLTYSEISVSVGMVLGLPAAALCLHLMGPTRADGLKYSLPHGRGSGYIIRPSEAPPADDTASIAPAVKSAPSESDLLGDAAAQLLRSLPSRGDELRAELDAAGVRKMLYPASLADPKRIRTARARIPKLDAHLAATDTAQRSALSQFPAKVNLSRTISQKQKADLLARARTSASPVVQRWTEYVALHRRLLRETDAALAHIESVGASRYAVENNQLLFAREADSKAFSQRQKQSADLWGQLDDSLRLLRAASDDANRSLKSAPTATSSDGRE